MRRIAVALFVMSLVAGCRALPWVRPTPKPTPRVMADAFVYAYAYVDANGNGQYDETDPPLAGCTLSVTEASGRVNGARSMATGMAEAWYPGGGLKYPITLRMTPPKDSKYQLLGPTEIVQPQPGSGRAVFLFGPLATPTP